MKFINKTPHCISINGVILEPVFPTPRVKTHIKLIRSSTFDIYEEDLGNVENIENYENDTYFIVSRMVFDALPHRLDLVYPRDFIRDDAGQIIGCKSFGGRTD